MTNTHHPSCKCIGIIGLGYVGLPLAVAFGSKQRVIGFDINKDRVESLRQEIDITNEVSTNEIREAVHLTFSSSPQSLEKCDTIIVTVPTPVDRHNRPNLSMLHEASKLVGEHLQPAELQRDRRRHDRRPGGGYRAARHTCKCAGICDGHRS